MLSGSYHFVKFLIILSITGSVVIIDHITKRLVSNKILMHEHIDVLPFLRIVHVENEGAAFGLFTRLGNDIFIFISLCAIIVIILILLKIPVSLELMGLSLILGGAIGNLIDRLRIGRVVDFIDLYVGKWHWPAFNIADSALTVGIVIFLLKGLQKRHD